LFKKLKIELKTNKEIEIMKVAGKVVGEVLEKVKELIKPGIKTKEIDVWIEGYIRSLNMEPAFLGVEGKFFPFPASACISINNELVHGIPDSRKLELGDIVSIDTGVIYNGYYGDAARTYPVGDISKEASKLLEITEKSLANGIKQAGQEKRLGDISHAIQKTIEDNGFSVVRDFCGHGIGRSLHEDPPVFNFGDRDRGVKLQTGMVLAIEPMANVGGYEVRTLENGWTVVTKDRSLCAHFEDTIAITEHGVEILTKV
jgi:methionyl aminopeptidase